MQISPRYDGPPVLELNVAFEPGEPLLRQRRRLGEFLTTLDDAGWAMPSRCDQWSVQDVVAHLVGTNQFWCLSIGAGLAGEPTKFLATFDPVATPAQMVDGLRTMSSVDVLRQYVDSVEQLAAVVEAMDDDAWSTLAEAPPGHVAIRAVALHALWDAWTHERDILLPLGVVPPIEHDELEGCLLYAAAIAPAIRASAGSTRRGILGVKSSDPDTAFVIEVGPTIVVDDGVIPSDVPCLEGDAVMLIEGLTYRVPFTHGLADDDAWLVKGLGAVFDQGAA